jgi:transcriptional regulator with XRE-family HTH domain
MNKHTTGAILKSLREEHGYSQKQVADKLGIKRTTYVKYETGAINPSRKLKELASLFNVSVGFLLGPEQHKSDTKFELQLFSNNARVAELSGEILSMKDDKKIALTVDILNRIKTMSTDQIEA